MNNAVQQLYAQRNILNSNKLSLPPAPAPPSVPLPPSSPSSISSAPPISETMTAACISTLPPAPVAPELNQNIKDILLMMPELHLITNDDIAFDLTGEFLILDGMKVSTETYQKFREIFIKNTTDHYTYYKNGGTVHCEVSLFNEPSALSLLRYKP